MPESDSIFTSDPAPQSERLLYLPVEQLVPGPNAPAAASAPAALIDSMRKFGVLQPLLARKSEEGYQVVAGFKRLAAAREAGLTEVPVRVYRVDDSALAALYTATNLKTDRIQVGAGKAPSRNNGLSRLLEEELNSPRPRPRYKLILGTGTAVVLLGWLTLNLWGRFHKPGDGGDPEGTTPPPATATPHPAAAVTPAAAGTARPAPAGRTRGYTVADWRRTLTSIRGVEVRDVAGTPRIVFQEPIFSSLTTIDTDQKQRLLSVITAIRGTCDACMVAVVGHTDNDRVRPGGAYASNEELGRLRAEAVVDFLTNHAGVPASHLRPLSSGANDPPFSNDTAATKKKNRTVTLEIIQPSGVR